MESMKRLWNYLTTLEWTERVQQNCKFCDQSNFASIAYENEEVIAVDNIRPSGQFHWLIMPKQHAARDIENLGVEHLGLLYVMDDTKHLLIQSHCPDIPRSAIHSGYHRGRRPMLGNIYYPDIISVHHLHLHVIVKPSRTGWLLKYPAWLTLMWKSDNRVICEVQKLSRRTM